jgi:hypothetical protein
MILSVAEVGVSTTFPDATNVFGLEGKHAYQLLTKRAKCLCDVNIPAYVPDPHEALEELAPQLHWAPHILMRVSVKSSDYEDASTN